MTVEWETISTDRACEHNNEGIIRLSGVAYKPSERLAHCQRDCADTAGCIAVDW